MSPALGGFNPRSPFGQLTGQKTKVPELFFTLTEAEIVDVLVSQGFAEHTAKKEAAKFERYKRRIVGPRQVWSDDSEQPPAEKQATTKRFADVLAERKGGTE